MEGIVKLLNYAASHPDAQIQYRASDMVLWVDSDASYLSETKLRSTCAGYHFLSDHIHLRWLSFPARPPI